MIGWIKKLLFKQRPPTLREACVKEYGEEFGELMDSIAEGCPVGSLMETLVIIEMIERVKQKWE